MENREDTVRIKKEPDDTWLYSGDDNIFDSVDSYVAKNFAKFKFYQSSANHVNGATILSEKLVEKVYVDFECKNVKPQLKFLSTSMCKTEFQNYPPIVKNENENQIGYFNKKN
ncbi:uncharacterized protein LOC106648321 isoform X1 [Trichogramma pretiosum]|uniref:uncharacterized protein LOC106648321 isoform X1 n=1 Tax=Trichogramma pretiosum TaxID=7493 RepID=UPI0006C9AA82|nr:uncharacterized protein LOC106648321 isoform X1 [Trichogramma pretiosum]